MNKKFCTCLPVLFRTIPSYLLTGFAIAQLQACSPAKTLPCRYVPVETKANQYPELTEYKNCAKSGRNHKVTVNKKHLESLAFNPTGLAEIRINDSLYYINKQGKLARSYFFDNGADYFVEGLSRTVQQNKFGFINTNLDTVIEPVYDFAFPFSNGLSKVCIGCTDIKAGEHTEMQNGKWGMIDKSGNVVIEITYEINELNQPGFLPGKTKTLAIAD